MKKYLILLLTLISFDVLAHESSLLGFRSGLFHPVLGLDHLLAMVSVGIVSYQIGNRAIWLVPSTFVIVMAIGGAIGLTTSGLLGVEFGIALSVCVLGFSIAKSKILKLPLIYLFVCIFSFFHGYAHGQEIPELATSWSYVVGFMIGTALIHILGVFIGSVFEKYKHGVEVSKALGFIFVGMGFHMVLSMLGL
tara:strand:- start:34 stop:612 length:579 start_codon:yes stop_codon:yes gene_type:complete